MANVIVYATARDGDLIKTWINRDPAVVWIIKISEHDRVYPWQAQRTIDVLLEQDYALWHPASGGLNIPSGSPDVPDTMVADPFAGWTQTLATPGETAPWFGANLPGPYRFSFHESGCEGPNSLGRSEFSWALDRYKAIGNPAHPAAKRWWFPAQAVRCFTRIRGALARSSPSRYKAYIFPDALAQLRAGRQRDVNPWRPAPGHAA